MADDKADPASVTRGLIRAADRAVLSTAFADAEGSGDAAGWPYGSLAMVACDHAARPLLLISDLAEHTRNLAADPRASLLFDGTAGLENPLTGPRATVLGRFTRSDDEALAARYVARHPDAQMYLGFADFHLYAMTVERAHIVAGFGTIHWIETDDLLFGTAGFEALADAEAGIVEHMNADHADAVGLYATTLLGLSKGDWRMIGIDPEGIDLREGGRTARLAFETPVRDAETARAALVAMTKAARAAERR